MRPKPRATGGGVPTPATQHRRIKPPEASDALSPDQIAPGRKKAVSSPARRAVMGVEARSGGAGAGSSMAIRHPGVIRGDVLRLFEGGSVAGMDDGELLARFAERRDEAAFEALVDRLGPMVLGVCRRMLADPRDVEDAFQATFLVLVRRAGSIRDRELVGPWLHGVAVRVARRARVLAVRRAIRERREDADVMVPERPPVAEWSEVRAAIDEEIGRLPEHHRRPVVLCDVEGLSREEAAARLGWTLNMVRGRLDRARGRLRDRLDAAGDGPVRGVPGAGGPSDGAEGGFDFDDDEGGDGGRGGPVGGRRDGLGVGGLPL